VHIKKEALCLRAHKLLLILLKKQGSFSVPETLLEILLQTMLDLDHVMEQNQVDKFTLLNKSLEMFYNKLQYLQEQILKQL
jgi:hypothetical protein